MPMPDMNLNYNDAIGASSKVKFLKNLLFRNLSNVVIDSTLVMLSLIDMLLMCWFTYLDGSPGLLLPNIADFSDDVS